MSKEKESKVEEEKDMIKISKSYSRKLTMDYQTWGFNTSLTRTIEVKDGKDLLKQSDKLFDTAKKLTQRDIKKVKKEIEDNK